MPHLWVNDWKTAVLLYGIPMLAVDLDHDGGIGYRVFLVVVFWIGAALRGVDYARSSSVFRTMLLSEALQLATLLWVILASLGRGVTFDSWWMPVAALAAAVPLTVLCEARLSGLLPRYGLESLVITVAGLLYMFVRAQWPGQTVPAILVANLAVFVIAMSRSSRLDIRREPGPVPANDQILETWQVHPVHGSRLHRITSALVSPIGLLGLVLIIAECALIVRDSGELALAFLSMGRSPMI